MYQTLPDPGRIPPSMKVLRRYNVNRAFDIRPAYPAMLAASPLGAAEYSQMTEGPRTVSAPSPTVQQMVANQLKIEEQLVRLIYASQFEQAWQTGIVPTESFTLKDKTVVKVPSRFFNWSNYRFDWDAARMRKARGSLIMATHPKIRKFTADEIDRLWALTIHEDGGPVRYTGDKMRRFLALQNQQWESAVRPIAMYKIPAMMIAPSRERRKISESLLKVGTMAVAVVGAAFLGNAIVSKLGAGAAEGAAAAAGSTGASASASIAAGQAAAVGISVPVLSPTITATIAGKTVVAGSVLKTAGAVGASTILGIVKESAPKVINTINTTRAITAMAKGELPPPPIRPMDGSFTDWAMLVAQDKIHRKLSEGEEKLLLEQIMSGQNAMALYGGNSPTTSGSLDPRIVAMQGQEKDKVPAWLMLLPVAALFLMG